MTKPDWCPADVWASAVACYEGMPIVYDGWDETELCACIARAILAERERALEEAAGVADARSQIDPDEDNIDPYDEWEIGMRVSAASIAHAIRALKETP